MLVLSLSGIVIKSSECHSFTEKSTNMELLYITDQNLHRYKQKRGELRKISSPLDFCPNRLEVCNFQIVGNGIFLKKDSFKKLEKVRISGGSQNK